MGGRYFEPETVEEAVGLAAEHGPDARFVAGGTDLVVLARKTRTSLPRVLIALHRIDELRGVAADATGALRVGAGTSHDTLVADPTVVSSFSALADGSALVGSPATRHVGTIGGNLCNASPANETGSPLLVFAASAEAASTTGRRTLSVEAMFVGPGATSLGQGELLVAVTVPPLASTLSADGSLRGSAYVRLDYRLAMEIAVVGAAAAVALGPDGRIADARLALTAVAPTCVLVPGVAEALRGREPVGEALRDAGALAEDAARPIDDVRAPADYRRAMVPIIAHRALAAAAGRAAGEGVPIPATLAMAAGGPGEVA